ncbi:MAG: aminodeoxychorismate synthase component I [Sulfurovum sp.]
MWLNRESGFTKITQLAKKREPFLFVTSFDQNKIFAKPLDTLDSDIYYKIEEKRNYKAQKREKEFSFSKHPIEFKSYKQAFNRVIEEIQSGNSYLLNLTFATHIETNLTLQEIFTYSKAKFKLYFKDEFICFSPERFVEIEGNSISTYPMKGTIDANIPNAKEKILNNPKELAEHIMIVDLMRNDLGIIANDVKVEKFRFVEKIKAGEKELLQVSSHISAKLSLDWRDNLGIILSSLLPAGSITGTPKKSTTNIINRIEDYHRGFYTGVFGVFDGASFYSAVMIRFIEKSKDKLVYKSGGGITIDSNLKSEYDELLDKIYIAV